MKFANCLHFANRFARNELGKTTTIDSKAKEGDVWEHYGDKINANNGDTEYHEGWFVSMKEKRKAFPNHIGVCYEGRILHYWHGNLYNHRTIDIIKMGFEIVRYYEGVYND